MIPGLGRSPEGGHGNWLQYPCLENLHGQRYLVGSSPWDSEELDTTEWLSTAQHSTWRAWIVVFKLTYLFWTVILKLRLIPIYVSTPNFIFVLRYIFEIQASKPERIRYYWRTHWIFSKLLPCVFYWNMTASKINFYFNSIWNATILQRSLSIVTDYCNSQIQFHSGVFKCWKRMLRIKTSMKTPANEM